MESLTNTGGELPLIISILFVLVIAVIFFATVLTLFYITIQIRPRQGTRLVPTYWSRRIWQVTARVWILGFFLLVMTVVLDILLSIT